MVARWADQQQTPPVYVIQFEGVDIAIGYLAPHLCEVVRENFGCGAKVKWALQRAGARARQPDAKGFVFFSTHWLVVPLKNGKNRSFRLRHAMRIIAEFDDQSG